MRPNDLLQAEVLTQAASAKRLGIAQPHGNPSERLYSETKAALQA